MPSARRARQRERRAIGYEWVLVANPGFEGEPRILKPDCHDGTPFVTGGCPRCGSAFHLHESQTEAVPPDAEVGGRCPSCRKVAVFPPGFFAAAFQRMRDDGWIE